MSNITQEKAEQIVRELLKKSNKRFKQELAGENEEFLNRAVRQHCASVARTSWRNSQKWCKWNDDGPVLMPDYTRIYYRKGSTEMLVQEYPPQVRLMKLRGALCKRDRSDAAIEPSLSSQIFHYSLALPYVVFIFKFTKGMLAEVRCAFSDRPLKKLDEKPLRPYLSNIDSNLTVCHGSAFDKSLLQKDNITQQSALTLGHFWHSAYSDEWSGNYWANRNHFTNSDPRLAGPEQWMKASEENPLFVVEDVKWLPIEGPDENFGDMIVRMMANDKESHDLNEDLYKDLVEDFLSEIGKSFKESVDSIEDKAVDGIVKQLAAELVEKVSS